MVSFSGLNPFYCHDEGTSVLTGNPSPTPSTSGVFGGPGIQDNEDGTAIFDPVAAGEGSFSGGVGVSDNGNGTATFNPATAGVGGPYYISYSYTNNDGCSNTYIGQTTVNELPTVTFGTLNSEYCVDYGLVTLMGNHAPQGSFSGAGIFDNENGTATFDPSAAGQLLLILPSLVKEII
ncbi:MAG: hypothetical protein B7C24_06505 [Bacteroidetes bacterium 4572_77]|nr:MAG: hypothetical protein B7C24_06505 [Bacteroidetes bacterium 4572_77]